MVDSVGPSSAAKSALQNLKRVSQQTNQAMDRLNTGLRVNNRLDGAQDFFASHPLTKSATDLTKIKDQVGQAINTIQAASVGLGGISDLMDQARAVTLQAQNTSDSTELARLAEQFNQVRNQIDRIATDANFGGINLIKPSPDTLNIALDDDAASLVVQGADSSSAGIGLSARTFGSATDIVAALADLSSALTQIRSNSNSLASNTRLLESRVNFTENLAITLEQGAAHLTQTDLNEEAASLLSLQTRQALGANALRISSDNERAVLGLFG